MPNTFNTPGTTVRKVDITQVFNAWTSGSATYGVPFNVAVSSSLTALKIRQNGAGSIAEFLKSDGTVVFSIDNDGAVSGISFGAGSEPTPALYLNGDSDTGLWQPDVDQLAVSLGGTKKVQWEDGSLEFLDTLKVTQGTLTADAQGFTHSVVWNSGATTFTALKSVVTDTASASASLLLDLQAGASPASVFSVRKDGKITVAGGADITGNVGVGVTPSAWSSGWAALQIGQAGAMAADKSSTQTLLRSNSYYDGTDNRAIVNAAGVQISMLTGALGVLTAPSVAAGAVQTFTERLTVSEGAITGTVTGNITLNAGSGSAGSVLFTHVGVGSFVGPAADNTYVLGSVNNRWTAVYAVNGSIQTSSRDMKEHIVSLAPEDALAAVRATPIYTFTYKGSDRPNVGFLADEAPDLLSPDHASASPQTTAAVALAAVKALDARLAAAGL